jgi:hypothetical protein
MEKYCFRCNKKTNQTFIEDKKTYLNTVYKRGENKGRIMFKCVTVCEECSTETGRYINEEPVKIWSERIYVPKYNKPHMFTFKGGTATSEQDVDY